jgi:hypothetical protein
VFKKAFFWAGILLTSFGRPSHASPRIGFWGGGAPGSPEVISHIPSRQLGIAAVQWGWDVGRWRSLRLTYTADLVPLVLIAQPREEGRYLFTQSGEIRNVHQGPQIVYGAGALPVGWRLTFRRESRVAPFLAGAGGFLLTTKKVPYQVPDGTAYNFMFHVGGGVQIAKVGGCDLLFGYSWWHLSNARLTRINPGIDENLFYAGLLF